MVGLIREPEVEESMGFLLTAAMGKLFTMALGIQATISNIAVSRAFGALRVVVPRPSWRRTGYWAGWWL
jgi:hypothetical protein